MARKSIQAGQTRANAKKSIVVDHCARRIGSKNAHFGVERANTSA